VNKLRIAMIVSPWYSVPPDGYGGIELMAYLLATELQRRGHEVTVLGRLGSRGPFEVLAVAPESWTPDLGSRNQPARDCLFLYRAYEVIRRRAFDIVHDHSGFMGMVLAATMRAETPVVATLHGDLTEAEGEFLAAIDNKVHLVAISRSQETQVAGVDWKGVVYNAVDLSKLRPSADKDDYILHLARIDPDKGQHVAIEFAKRVGAPLILAGKLEEPQRRYFAERIEPHLGNGVSRLENVAGAEKTRLLARARALVFPLQWEEPFGLAMVEAMASGTPVLALARGAAVELVEPGVTGFLADDVDGLVEAYGRLDEIDTRRCAERARERFSPERMAEGYESIYQAALQHRFYNPVI
jgi:glycosyltransferase involved in cell wall biosynthesis